MFAAVATALLGYAAETDAAPLYDSITSNSPDAFDAANSQTWLAGQFLTDSNQYNLQSVVLSFATTPLGTIEADIYADNSGKPGSLLGALTSPGSFGTGANSFSASGFSPLAANSSFWVVLRGVGLGSADWNTTTGTVSGPGASTYTSFSSNSGALWAPSSQGDAYMMTVNAVVVPEPSTWAMGIAGLGFVALQGIRRRRPS